jgi:hypothetical protein
MTSGFYSLNVIIFNKVQGSVLGPDRLLNGDNCKSYLRDYDRIRTHEALGD